jgi:hypothetical protein
MKKIILFISFLTMSSSLFACRVTLLNDTNNTLFVIDDLVGRGFAIKKGKKAVYGETTRRPVMRIFKNDKETNAYHDIFTVRQIACSGNKEITLRGSDVLNASYDKQLFDVQPRQVDGVFIGVAIKK